MKRTFLKGLQTILLTTVFVISVFAVWAIAPAPTSAQDPSGLCSDGGFITNPANGHRYCLVSDGSWDEAQQEAQAIGGNLVTVNDQAEQDWLYDTFGNGFPWIGLSDAEIEGTYKWASGQPLDYTNWSSGEPNNYGGNEDYVEMSSNRSGKWNDLPSTHRQGIAEIENQIVNIDARANHSSGTAVIVSMDPGTYTAHIIGTADGGTYDAWSRNSFNKGCDADGNNCKYGFEHKYAIRAPKLMTVKRTGRYETPELALQNAPADVTFTLDEATDVKFYVYDTKPSNNRGGVSLLVE